ncbi:MAG TPA: chlorophyll synthesis pathway protein BchC, partial [Rhodospirillaceae bacterium]|nr:chlorophyll synthesis pathway protein BchC [Rhodospirillaceae bacterium]
METQAIIFEKPEALAVRAVELKAPAEDDLIVDVAWSGVSTGTERLLWTGRMPQFPGMGYPLVPGYEAVGRISRSARDCSLREGDFVFVPGASCFGEVRGLFGGSARRLVVPAR